MCCDIFLWLFYILCVLTGQFIVKPPSGIPYRFFLVSFSCVAFLLYSLPLNLFSFGFNVYVIWDCPYKNCGYIDTGNVTLIDHGLPPETQKKFNDFQRFVFTSSTFSGMISYVCMMYVLCTHYNCVIKPCLIRMKKAFTAMWKKCDGEKLDDPTRKQLISGVQLNPFCDEASDGDSTVLRSKQSSYYNFIFLLNFFISFASIATFFILFGKSYDHHDTKGHLAVNIIGLVSQFYTWFCAILSCFIFSKVAYAVVNICYQQLYSSLEYVALQEFMEEENMESIIYELQKRMKFSIPNNDELNHLKARFFNISCLERMKEIDKWYTDTVKRSLRPFGTWFALHWLAYTFSAFLSMSYVIESALVELYGNGKSNFICRGKPGFLCRLTLSYMTLFSLAHCILFLYPCFRAASVTAARHVLIKRVSKARWPNVPFEQKQLFIQFLKDENCTFNVSIFCAELSFGFNVAFFSIFIGLLGVVLKITL